MSNKINISIEQNGVIGLIRNCISNRGIGYCVVKNDKLAVDDFMKLLNDSIGHPIMISDSSNEKFKYDIVMDRGEILMKANNIPLLSSSNSLFPLHTDCSYLERTADIVILYCIKNSEYGGESILLNINKITRFLSQDYLELLLEKRFNFRSNAHPILEKGNDLYFIRYHIGELLADLSKNERINVENDLKDLNYLFTCKEHYTSLKLLPHECLIINNRTTLHGRLPFEKDSERTFYRLRQYSRNYE